MINIVTAYPDFLDLYGEYSAAKLLERRLTDAGRNVRVTELGFGRYSDLEAANMVYFGAGTEDRILAVLSHIRLYSEQLKAFVERGGLLEASGSSMALFCRTVTDTRDGKTYEGLGLFDAEAVITPKRRYGELICSYGGRKVIGAVNSSIDFLRGSGQEALFTVLWDSSGRFQKGSGEGFRAGDSVFASEITGPLICRNPFLLDEIAEKLAGEKLPECRELWYMESLKAYDHALDVLLKEARLKEEG
ncbi:MAG: hypothetical protein IKZ63_05355 [Oscillospiraceae bacterium]|nr:hypothetical protein [Oscillospiraceae bacterium]